MNQATGWDVFQSETTDNSEFDLWGVVTESQPMKMAKIKVPTEHFERAPSSCSHTWAAEEHVHNKGKGKYQWYLCKTCKGRQRRLIKRRRNCKKK